VELITAGAAEGSAWKVAVTLWAPVMATTHAPVPEHAPLHPAKTDPLAAD
jgi:hypothetical protein